MPVGSQFLLPTDFFMGLKKITYVKLESHILRKVLMAFLINSSGKFIIKNSNLKNEMLTSQCNK